jgi:magnesium-transporting ATPase (P-type)
MAYSGTMVTTGQAQAIVVATGAHAEIGRLSALIRRIERVETPLLRQMNRFTRQLSIAIVGAAGAVFVFALAVRGYEWGEAFLVMVGIVVAAIPEGLPAVMTITLAIGVRRMAARHAIVRRLPAVETLGSVSTICTDKTGTLTRNEMTVRSVILAERRFEVTGTGYEPRGAFRTGERDVDPTGYPQLRMLGLAGLLCSDARLRRTADGWFVDGDPMEGALLSLASKMGIDPELARKQYPRNDEIPFDARHRFMATLHHSHDEGTFVFVKGAPERLLEMCSGQLQSSGPAAIDRDYWSLRTDELARNGYRVLALATKDLPRGTQDLRFSDVTDSLSLIGVVGLIDPPRAEAIAAVEDCRHAGVKVMMITGDHPVTAQAIALQLGLQGDAPTVTGQMLDSWSDTELRHQVATRTVFARTTPENKLRLVNALQADGAVVAMTGDGVNDAPALKRADVGIAMGRKGSEAAKEAAEIVLADDNFASIVAALREGRTVYDNLKKVIGWTLPTNVGEALALVIAVLLGWTLPLTPLQILWINMVTEVALGLVLAFEPTEPETMRRPPRAPHEPFLSGYLVWRIVFVGILFVIGVFGTYFWALDRGLGVEGARTVVVNTMVVMEIFYLFSIRYVQGTSLTWRGVLGTPAVLLGVSATIVAQIAFTYFGPLQAVFDSRSLGFVEGIVIVATGVTLLLVVELEKYLSRRINWNINILRYRHPT